jgi:hypothetical protein
LGNLKRMFVSASQWLAANTRFTFKTKETFYGAN